MRVAFVTVGATSRMTGGYLYNARVLAGLRRSGVEVKELVAGGADPDEQIAWAPRVGTLLDAPSYDVILVDALARIAVAPHLDRWRAFRPVVALVHELPSAAGGSLEAWTTADQQAYEEPLLRAERLVAVSEHGRALLEARGVPPERVRIVPPGFDRLAISDKTPPGRRGAGPVRVLCVAQWIPRKGILTLARAWARDARPGAVLELVGETDADPAYTASVRDELASASAGSVLISGAVDDAALSDAYAAADLFVLSSRYEGYGMAYAEALSFGLPVVACEVGPVPCLVGRDAALLVPPDDADALANALDLLLENRGLRDRMSAAARRRTAVLPRWEDAVAGLHETLLDAVARNGVRPDGKPQDRSVQRSLREQNRRSWNVAVGAHESHRKDLAGFLRAGGTTLFYEERELLGDLLGETVAHLQCNSGGDSLSLAALGTTVVGVDSSDEALSSARALSEKTGIPARFERADVYDWLEGSVRQGRRFDVVYSSYGVVCWLPNLEAWAAGIAAILEPGGRFVLVDFHPAAEMFDAGWNRTRSYPTGGESLHLDEGVGDYVGESGGGLTPGGFSQGMRGFENPEPCHLFRWGLGEIVTALAGAGLRISALKEYPYANGERHFSDMRELPGRRMAPPEGVPTVPLMYGLRAEKDADT